MTDDEDPEGTWSVPGQLGEGACACPCPTPPWSGSSSHVSPRPSRDGSSGTRMSGSRPAPIGRHPHRNRSVVAGPCTPGMRRQRIPEPLLASVLKVAEGHLLVASADAFLDGDGMVPTALRNAQLCEALVSAGIDEPLGPIATALAASERMGGQLRMPDRSDAVVALIHAAAPLMVGSPWSSGPRI